MYQSAENCCPPRPRNADGLLWRLASTHSTIMRGLWLSGIASVLSVCVSAKALQETAGEEHWKASQQQTRRARPSKPRDHGGEPAYSQDQFVSWNVGPSSLCEIDQMNASAIPIPPPSAHDLAEWISIDWDQEASLVSYRQRKDSQRTIVRQICLMLTFTAALLLCLVVWATGGASRCDQDVQLFASALTSRSHLQLREIGQIKVWRPLALLPFLLS